MFFFETLVILSIILDLCIHLQCRKTSKNFNSKINIEGIGLHSGKLVNLKILPAEEDHGIKFKRTDISENNIIEAKFENVTDPVLCTKDKKSKRSYDFNS